MECHETVFFFIANFVFTLVSNGDLPNFQGSAPNLQAIWIITFVATDFSLPGSKFRFFSVITLIRSSYIYQLVQSNQDPPFFFNLKKKYLWNDACVFAQGFSLDGIVRVVSMRTQHAQNDIVLPVCYLIS